MKYLLLAVFLLLPFRVAIADDSVIHPDKELTPRQMIVLEFGKSSVMKDIAKAESRFDPLAKNPDSSAKGLYQILDGTWKDYGCLGNVLDARDNIACARIIYDKSNTQPWLASKDNWQ